MNRVTSALMSGILQVIGAPGLVLLALLATLLAAAPFGVALNGELQNALANQPPIALGSGEIDADWWSEFRDHAGGLAATFTPTVIGFAAPLDNLSAVLDGTARPMVLALPVGIAMLVWAWLWGVALFRFDRDRQSPFAAAILAGFSNLPRFAIISVTAAVLQLALYLTLHRALFGPLYRMLVGDGASEPAAFAIRIVFYAIFGAAIAIVSLVADYARVAQMVSRPSGMLTSIGAGAAFVRRNLSIVMSLYLMTGALFVMLFAGFGIIDIYGRSRVGGWRGIAVAQAFILGRLIVRLIFGASELQLYKTGDQRSR